MVRKKTTPQHADVLDAALRRSFHVGLALERLATARLATVTDGGEVTA